MASAGPGLGQREVVWLEAGRRGKTLGFLVVSLLGIGVLAWCLAYRSGEWPETLPPSEPIGPGAILAAARLAAAIAVVFLLTMAWNGYRWHVGREVRRLVSHDPAGAYLPVKVAGHSRRRAPERPVLQVCGPPRLPRPRGQRVVDRRHNVLGRPPLRIGYLRVFENNARARAFAGDAWREFGHVHLIRSATAVRPRELRQLREDPADELVSDHGSLVEALSRNPGPPLGRGAHVLHDLSPYPIWTWDWYGAYPIVSPLCHGSFWRAAVDHLLTRVDVVVLDLSGLRPRNAGTLFEVQRVIDRYPIERVIFLIDPRSKWRYVERVIHTAWDGMDADSPNAGHGRKRAVVAWTDRFVTEVTQHANGGETRRTRLRSQRRRTRKLAAWMQDRSANAPPVPRLRPSDVVEAPRPPARPPRRTSLMPAVLLTGVLAGLSAVTVLYTATAETMPAATPSPSAVPVPGAPITPAPAPSSPQPRPTPVVVPEVRHLDEDAARDRLQAADLIPGGVQRVLSPEAEGVVLTTDPAAGTPVQPGSLVDFVVASGQNTVPDVREMTQDAATAALRDAGFEVDPREEPVQQGDDGIVVGQEPASGEERPVGSTVAIQVSVLEGPSPSTGPTPPREDDADPETESSSQPAPPSEPA